MANYNYAPIVPRVQAKIAQYGRNVSFIKRSVDTPINDPLAGPQSADIISASVPCVFVPLTGLAELGIKVTKQDAFKTSTQVGLLAPSAINYAEQTFIIDSMGGTWKIDVVDALAPGDTPLLYFIGVSRP